LLTGAAKGDPVKGFGQWAWSRMTDESDGERLGNSRETDGPARRHRFGGRKETASCSLCRRTGRRVRLTRRHRAAVGSTAAAAGRKPGARIGCKHCRRDQRKAEQHHQQHREAPAHSNYCTRSKGLAVGRRKRLPHQALIGPPRTECRRSPCRSFHPGRARAAYMQLRWPGSGRCAPGASRPDAA